MKKQQLQRNKTKSKKQSKEQKNESEFEIWANKIFNFFIVLFLLSMLITSTSARES